MVDSKVVDGEAAGVAGAVVVADLGWNTAQNVEEDIEDIRGSYSGNSDADCRGNSDH